MTPMPPSTALALSHPPHRRRTQLERRFVPISVALCVFLGYLTFALREHSRFKTTAYDLGIFGQAVRSYANLHLPESEIRTATAPEGFDASAYPLLGDHFHPILAILGPIYRLFPHIETLLIAQALLVGVSTYVISWSASKYLGRRWPAFCIGTAYGLSWGLQELIGFDFHEVAFAVPLVALAGGAYLDGRWVASAWWASTLMLVKEDLGATSAVLGIILIRYHRKAGLLLFGASIIATALIVLVALPAFSPNGQYGYITQPHDYGFLDGWRDKACTLLALAAVTAGLAFRSPFVLLALPTLVWRMFSSNPEYWGTTHHYSAVLMPILFIALIDAARRNRSFPMSIPLLISLLLFFGRPLSEMATEKFWLDDPRLVASRTAIDLVPPDGEVATSNSLAPHLTDKAKVYIATYGVLDKRKSIEWLVVDVHGGWRSEESIAALRDAEEGGWQRIFADQGIHVLKRPVSE
ncbi:DUF2079 domain-containing protein [Streptomyces sp. NPDC048442]|uniref:DUF2079 domain-containing protein n=1 Tax=Streptomyces sp. NPDC048442 TaxID=3154823 RepID=UPI003416F684